MNQQQEYNFIFHNPIITRPELQYQYCSTCQKYRNYSEDFKQEKQVNKTCIHCRDRRAQKPEYQKEYQIQRNNKEENIKNQPIQIKYSGAESRNQKKNLKKNRQEYYTEPVSSAKLKVQTQNTI